jgi:hypothetical protein
MPIAGAPSDNTTLVAILAAFEQDGFAGDMFVTDDGEVRCGACRHTVAPADMEVHAIRRVEGASDPADMAAVLALVCEECGARGTAIVRFGPEASAGDAAVLAGLEDHRLD